jgi:hypothetical protein
MEVGAHTPEGMISLVNVDFLDFHFQFHYYRSIIRSIYY